MKKKILFMKQCVSITMTFLLVSCGIFQENTKFYEKFYLNESLLDSKMETEKRVKAIDYENETCDTDIFIPYDLEFLAYIEIPSGYFIVDYAEISGIEFDFIVYKLAYSGVNCHQLPTILPSYQKPYWEIIILQNNVVQGTIRRDLSFITPETDLELIDIFVEIDANFDGKTDIAIFWDHGGATNAVRYELFLRNEDGFMNAISFQQNIYNPRIDSANQEILGNFRITNFSRARTIHRFIDGEFVMVEELVTEEIRAGDNAGKNHWLHRVLIDGVWQIKVSTYTEEYAIHPDSYWQNHWFGDRWEFYLWVAR